MKHLEDCQCDQCLFVMMTATDPQIRQQGWQAWYVRDSSVLQGYIQRRSQTLGCREHSEDILQDAFVIAFKNISTGRYQAYGKPLSAYLHGIARNLTYDVMRLQRREILPEEGFEAPVEEAISPDDKIYLDKILSLVAEADKQLSKLGRQVVAGLYAQKKTSQELSGELGKSATNIRAIAHRAVQAISDYLSGQHGLQLSPEAIRLCLQLL